MAAMPDPRVTQMEASMTLPRQNGELLFAAPWEARAFGLAVALHDAGVYPWRDFSAGLAAETATVEQHGGQATYYERWLETLEKLVIARGLVTREALDARTAAYALDDPEDHHEES